MLLRTIVSAMALVISVPTLGQTSSDDRDAIAAMEAANARDRTDALERRIADLEARQTPAPRAPLDGIDLNTLAPANDRINVESERAIIAEQRAGMEWVGDSRGLLSENTGPARSADAWLTIGLLFGGLGVGFALFLWLVRRRRTSR